MYRFSDLHSRVHLRPSQWATLLASVLFENQATSSMLQLLFLKKNPAQNEVQFHAVIFSSKTNRSSPRRRNYGRRETFVSRYSFYWLCAARKKTNKISVRAKQTYDFPDEKDYEWSHLVDISPDNQKVLVRWKVFVKHVNIQDFGSEHDTWEPVSTFKEQDIAHFVSGFSFMSLARRPSRASGGAISYDCFFRNCFQRRSTAQMYVSVEHTRKHVYL